MTPDLPTLTTIFQQVFDIPMIELHAATNAKDIPEWDSLMHIQIIVAVEKHFKIRFAPGEIDKLQNIGQFLELITQKVAQQSRP